VLVPSAVLGAPTAHAGFVFGVADISSLDSLRVAATLFRGRCFAREATVGRVVAVSAGGRYGSMRGPRR